MRADDKGAFSFSMLLLGGAMLLSVVLALQAGYAVFSHRTAARQVLKAYTTLAAKELSRRSLQQVGYYGLGYALRPLARHPWPQLPDLAGDSARSDQLVAGFFRYDASLQPGLFLNGSDGGLLSKENLDFMRANLPERPAYFRLFIPQQHHGWAIAYQSPGEDQGQEGQVQGLVFRLSALGAPLEKTLDQGSLLPVSLSGPPIGNEQLYLRVKLEDGTVVFEHGQRPGAESIQITEKMDGVLSTFLVDMALPLHLSHRLIIGGLPKSRLPLLGALLLVNLGLMILILLQWQRERRFSARQTDAMAGISHEFRTPLAQIRMFTDTLLLNRVRSPQEGRRALEIIQQETGRLERLVENVIQFARAMVREDKLSLAPVPVEDLFAEVMDTFSPLAAALDMQLRAELKVPAKLAVHKTALQQILANLIDNAMKYGPPGQTITLGQTGTVVWVEDEGPGIAVGDRARIWQQFERLDQDRNKATGGCGIGLTVVRRLAQAMGARVRVVAASSGGARFEVDFAAGS